MSQREINEAEWRDPANWRGGWLGIYGSRRDTRTWVPKKRPGFGWTLNLGSPSGRAIAIAFGVAIVAALAGSVLSER